MIGLSELPDVSDLVVKDEPAPSGEVRVVNATTGGEKGSKDERFDLVHWPFLSEVARVHGFGSAKYAPWNWAKGYDWSLSFAAMHRHLALFWEGEEYDEESGLHHLAHADWHLSVLYEFSTNKRYAELDDRHYKREQS